MLSLPSCNRQRGFSLLEILVAFSILALSLTVLLNIFSSGLRRTLVAEEYQQAVVIAQAKLAASGIEEPLQKGVQLGTEFDDKFNWRRQIERFDMAALALEVDKMTVDAYQITVTVDWSMGENTRQLELTTLKIVNHHAQKI